MATQKKRPGQSGETGNIRTKKIQIRLNDDELLKIEEQAKLKRKTTAKYVRDSLLYEENHKSKVKAVLTNLSTENYIKELNQLSRIGNNINQLAYRANKQELIINLLNELKTEIEEFKKWRKKQISKGE